MRPKEVVRQWVDAFNRADVDALTALYADDAINHQMPNEQVMGRDAIRAMFEAEFAAGSMFCIIESIFEDGEWAILEMERSVRIAGLRLFPLLGRKDQYSARLLGQANGAAPARYPSSNWIEKAAQHAARPRETGCSIQPDLHSRQRNEPRRKLNPACQADARGCSNVPVTGTSCIDSSEFPLDIGSPPFVSFQLLRWSHGLKPM